MTKTNRIVLGPIASWAACNIWASRFHPPSLSLSSFASCLTPVLSNKGNLKNNKNEQNLKGETLLGPEHKAYCDYWIACVLQVMFSEVMHQQKTV